MFLVDSFRAADFSPRTAEVSLPDLARWFDGPPLWKVRGLTASECACCDILAYGGRARLAEAAKLSDDSSPAFLEVPATIAVRIEYLIAGSVDLVCDYAIARKLSEVYPIEFLTLTLKIIELTGLGENG